MGRGSTKSFFGSPHDWQEPFAKRPVRQPNKEANDDCRIMSVAAQAAPRQGRGPEAADCGHLVFIDSSRGPLELDHHADRVRADLGSAGLKRADLTSTGP